jgi:hypothetical protein
MLSQDDLSEVPLERFGEYARYFGLSIKKGLGSNGFGKSDRPAKTTHSQF